MAKVLAGKPAIPFRIPPDIRLVRVNSTTGRPATPGDSRVILEAFKPGTIPVGRQQVLSGVGEPIQRDHHRRLGLAGYIDGIAA